MIQVYKWDFKDLNMGGEKQSHNSTLKRQIVIIKWGVAR